MHTPTAPTPPQIGPGGMSYSDMLARSKFCLAAPGDGFATRFEVGMDSPPFFFFWRATCYFRVWVFFAPQYRKYNTPS